jgi:hypothetical protein
MLFLNNKLGLICLFSSLISFANAQTSGPLVPMSYTTAGAGAGWSNLSGVQTVDNNPAYVDLAQFPTCNSFMCYRSNIASFSGFGFAVPIAANITGVQLDILQRVSSPGGGIHDSVLTLAMNNVAIGNNKASSSNWFDTPQTQIYGGSSDTWGNTLTANDVNDSGFGILYEITNTSYDQTASVDFMSMTIYYQIGTSIYAQNSSPWMVNLNENLLTIKGQIPPTKGTSLKVYNTNGQLVYHQVYETTQHQIDENISCSNWQSGLYLIHVESAAGFVYNKKLTLVK